MSRQIFDVPCDPVTEKQSKARYKTFDTNRIATWNMRGLRETGKLHIVEQELIRHRIKICGLSETNESGHFDKLLQNIQLR